jgi:hypothetical protein
MSARLLEHGCKVLGGLHGIVEFDVSARVLTLQQASQRVDASAADPNRGSIGVAPAPVRPPAAMRSSRRTISGRDRKATIARPKASKRSRIDPLASSNSRCPRICSRSPCTRAERRISPDWQQYMQVEAVG